MLFLDGSYGEGGGQLVRTALAFSTITNTPFSVTNIRKGRCTAGLKAQHLHCVKALEQLCGATATGASLGSEQLSYQPGKIAGQALDINVGTAGSITLVLQSLLLPCFFADKPVRLAMTGGTDCSWSMPIDYFREVLVPQLAGFCSKIEVNLIRRGYYPKGNGRVEILIRPKYSLAKFGSFEQFWQHLGESSPKIDIVEQGCLIQIKGISHAAKQLEQAQVAERQAKSAELALKNIGCPVEIQAEYCDTLSAGSGITLWAVFSKERDEIDITKPLRLGADSLGKIGKKAEAVGNEAAEMLIREIKSGAPVDEWLADNLVPWLALFSGRIMASRISSHTTTNIHVIEKFLGKTFDVKERIISAEHGKLQAGP